MKFNWRNQELYIDGLLAKQLDNIIYNIKKDWDFVILVSGNRMVRVGKSVMAMTVCAYLAWGLEKEGLNNNAYSEDNVVFNGKDLLDKSKDKPKYSIMHYDEGREGLAANKSMQSYSKDIFDFFAECGQKNHVIVVVMPDFFELKEEICVGRSEILLNVYRKAVAVSRRMYKEKDKRDVVKFERGFFQFFARDKKERLYEFFRNTRRKNYWVVKENFKGRFVNQYPINEASYRDLKKESFARFKEKREEDKLRSYRTDVFRDRVIENLLRKDPNMKQVDILKHFKEEYNYTLTQSQMSIIVAKIRTRVL